MSRKIVTDVVYATDGMDFDQLEIELSSDLVKNIMAATVMLRSPAYMFVTSVSLAHTGTKVRVKQSDDETPGVELKGSYTFEVDATGTVTVTVWGKYDSSQYAEATFNL